MSSTPKSSAAESAERRSALSHQSVRDAALLRFADQGYHGTSLREIATDLDVTVAAIYYYYPSKDELLTEIIEYSLRADFEAVAEIRARADAPILDDLIRLHVRRHIALREDALVVHHEARHLPPPYSERVRAILLEYEGVFRDAIVREWDIPSERLTMVTKVVLGMGAAVIHWFHPHALLSADEVAERYVAYAHAVLATEVRVPTAGTDPL